MIPKPKGGLWEQLMRILNKFVGDGHQEPKISNLFVSTNRTLFYNRNFLNLFDV